MKQTTNHYPLPNRLLLVEDETVMANNIIGFLENDGFQVTHCVSGKEGLKVFQDIHFDLIILDVMLPELNGLEICHQIRAQSDVPIIMLTALSEPYDVVKGLEAGADDYIKKPFSADELNARVMSALRRNTGLMDHQQQHLQIGDLKLIINSQQVMLKNQTIVDLTQAEFLLLKTLCHRPGQVFTRNQLIDACLGEDFNGFDRNIDVHISNLRKKLGESSRHPKHIITEIGIGYRLVSRV